MDKYYDEGFNHWIGQPVPTSGIGTMPPNFTIVDGKFQKIENYAKGSDV